MNWVPQLEYDSLYAIPEPMYNYLMVCTYALHLLLVGLTAYYITFAIAGYLIRWKNGIKEKRIKNEN